MTVFLELAIVAFIPLTLASVQVLSRYAKWKMVKREAANQPYLLQRFWKFLNTSIRWPRREQRLR